jgi:hypothetical protein
MYSQPVQRPWGKNTFGAFRKVMWTNKERLTAEGCKEAPPAAFGFDPGKLEHRGYSGKGVAWAD